MPQAPCAAPGWPRGDCAAHTAKPHPSLVGHGMPNGPLRTCSKRRLLRQEGPYLWIGPLISAAWDMQPSGPSAAYPLEIPKLLTEKEAGPGCRALTLLIPQPCCWTRHPILRQEKLAMESLWIQHVPPHVPGSSKPVSHGGKLSAHRARRGAPRSSGESLPWPGPPSGSCA